MTFRRLRGHRSSLAAARMNRATADFHELGLDFRDRLEDGLDRPRRNAAARTTPMGFLPVPRIRCVESACGRSRSGVPARNALPSRRFSRPQGFDPRRPCGDLRAADVLRVLPSKPFSSRPTLPRSSRGDPFPVFAARRVAPSRAAPPRVFVRPGSRTTETTVLQVESEPLLPWSFLASRMRRVSSPSSMADSAFPLPTNQDRGSAEGALRTPSPGDPPFSPVKARAAKPPEAPRESGEL